MKILQVITRSELGGAQTVVVQLSNMLSRNHEVVLAAGEGDGKMWEMVGKDVVREHCPHLQRALSLKNDLLAAMELRRLYRKYRPDVIHLHSSKAGTLGRIVFPRKKVVYTVHGFDSVRLAFRKFLPVERLLQHFCRAVVGVSMYDKRNLVGEGIVKGVSVVYNGIDRPQTEGLKRMEAMSGYDKVVLAIARVFPQKKPELFVEVARLLPEYGFIWIGNQREMTEYDLPENCRFAGNVSNAGAYCSMADLFVLPSNYEGLPMTVIEAMSFGKPVVASDVGGISEIVRNGLNGYVVPNEAVVFAEKIRYILENEEVYDSMSKCAKEIFENELTVDRMVEGYLKIYSGLL